jgi:hypothetical protein
MRWVSIKERLPKCDNEKDSFGVEVIVYPYIGDCDSAVGTAFFGKRITCNPSFYKYGALIDGITHWQPLPKAPVTNITGNNRKKSEFAHSIFARRSK